MEVKEYHFLFDQMDSWFFRESRSMDGSGATALNGLFPPPNNTLLGAIRTQIGNDYNLKNNENWSSFESNDDLKNIIGYADNYQSLKVCGTWLYNHKTQQLYFPSPMNLLQQANNSLGFFELGTPCRCDLGMNVILPKLNHSQSQNTIENAYLSKKGWDSILKGLPPCDQPISRQHIVTDDNRLGIGKDSQIRKAIDGKLYQTQHVRLKNDWCIYFGLSCISNEYMPKNTILRLGGEARMASLKQMKSAPSLPDKPSAENDNQMLVLYLLSMLPDYRSDTNIPALPNDTFQCFDDKDYTQWRGKVNGIDLSIVTSITGKLERIGGWDMVNRRSLPVKSYIPAGSCWYIEPNNNAQKIIDALHGCFITSENERALGYGQVVVGLAPKPID